MPSSFTPVALTDDCSPQVADGIPTDIDKFVFCEPEEFVFNYEENKFFDGFVVEEDFNPLDLTNTTPESETDKTMAKQLVPELLPSPTSSVHMDHESSYNFQDRMLSEESFYIPTVIAAKVQQLISQIEKTEQSAAFSQSRKLLMKSYCLLSSHSMKKNRILDNSEDTVVYASQSFFHMTGFKPCDVIGKRGSIDRIHWINLADQSQVRKVPHIHKMFIHNCISLCRLQLFSNVFHVINPWKRW